MTLLLAALAVVPLIHSHSYSIAALRLVSRMHFSSVRRGDLSNASSFLAPPLSINPLEINWTAPTRKRASRGVSLLLALNRATRTWRTRRVSRACTRRTISRVRRLSSSRRTTLMLTSTVAVFVLGVYDHCSSIRPLRPVPMLIWPVICLGEEVRTPDVVTCPVADRSQVAWYRSARMNRSKIAYAVVRLDITAPYRRPLKSAPEPLPLLGCLRCPSYQSVGHQRSRTCSRADVLQAR